MRMYVILRRRKKLQNQKLSEYAESQLVYRTFHTWLQKYHAHKRINELHAEVSQIETRFLTRRVFSLWQSTRESRVQLRLKEARMQRLYEKRLKQRAFAALVQNRNDHLEELLRLERAEKFDRTWTRRIYFDAWLQKLDEKRDTCQLHLVYQARKHYETKIVLICVNNWRSYVREQRDLKVTFVLKLHFL